MATNTTLIDYATYSYNDKQGRVPWADDSAKRSQFVTNILTITGLSP